MQSRKHFALEGRIAAAKLAYDRIHPEHHANGDELKYRFGTPTGFCRAPGPSVPPC